MVKLGTTMQRNRPPKRFADHHSNKLKQLLLTPLAYAASIPATAKLVDLATQYGTAPHLEGAPEGAANLALGLGAAYGLKRALFKGWKPSNIEAGPLTKTIQKHIWDRYETKIENKERAFIAHWLVPPLIAAATYFGADKTGSIDATIEAINEPTEGIVQVGKGIGSVAETAWDETKNFFKTFEREGQTTTTPPIEGNTTLPDSAEETRTTLYGPLNKSQKNTLEQSIERMNDYRLANGETIAEYAQRVSARERIPYELTLATIIQESEGHVNAKSKTGVQGLMQVTCGTARKELGYDAIENCGDEADPIIQLEAGIPHLATNYHGFRNLGLSDAAAFAAAAYNGGEPVFAAVSDAMEDIQNPTFDQAMAYLTIEDINTREPYFVTEEQKRDKIEEIKSHGKAVGAYFQALTPKDTLTIE